MKITVFCDSGSPLGIIPEDLYGRGLGGAEYALVSLTEEWARMGHEVNVFNDPRTWGNHNGVNWLPRQRYGEFSEGEEVFVLYRTPAATLYGSKAPLKVFWSCDQYTVGNFNSDILPFVDLAVTISPLHMEYFQTRYHARQNKLIYFDLGVRLHDYIEQEPIEKIKNRVIFCSVPDRGLKRLRAAWPKIKEALPDASIVITSDYRLWGAPDARNGDHVRDWRELKDVYFVGAVPRKRLVQYQLEAEFQLYPCTYEELFCVAVAECQAAGAIPITSKMGAVETTNEFGYALEGDPNSPEWLADWTEFAISVMRDEDGLATKIREDMKMRARERFSWSKIAAEWISLFQAGV